MPLFPVVFPEVRTLLLPDAVIRDSPIVYLASALHANALEIYKQLTDQF